MSFYSPIDRLAQNLPRPKGTGAEFMTELSKMPGYKSQEAEDRGLQALMNLPKMERAQFLEALKAKPVPQLEETTLSNKNKNSTKYEEYVLPGGTNYREILMQMPKKPDESWFEFLDRNGVNVEQYKKLPLSERQIMTAAYMNQKESSANYKSPHWVDHNVLAHVRAKDRVGPNGEKILHIEELQSDWHQKGREHGYRPPGQSERLTGKPYKIAEDEYGIKWSDGSVDDDGHSEDFARRIAEQGKLTGKVPDAPFKKNWHEMALKKMIHHAAANGYDAIAITPGAEQADRYGLAKHVGLIRHMTHIDNPNSGILFAYDPQGNQIVRRDDVPHAKLPEYIGKEGAQKLMDQKPDSVGYRELSGQNLQVGGEGMKGFYDKIVPNFLNQFGKKYGAKVQQGQVNIDDPNGHSQTEMLRASGIPEQNWGQLSYPQTQQMMAEYSAKQPPKMAPVHIFPITPEMREDVVKNGVPLYAGGGKVSRAKHDANLAKFLSESKVKDRMYHGTQSHDDYEEDSGAAIKQFTNLANWVAKEPYTANTYAGKNGYVMPVHINIKKPLRLGFDLNGHLDDALKTAKRLGVDTSIYSDEMEPYHVVNSPEFIEAAMKRGYDGITAKESGRITHAVFDPRMIKSAIGNRGTYDPKDPDITKAKGGVIKPVGYTKERITVSPNLDAMRYELESVKHYSKKVK